MVSVYYKKTAKEDYKSNGMLDLLEELGYLERSVHVGGYPTDRPKLAHRSEHMTDIVNEAKATVSKDTNPYLGNGMPIESNMESIARVNLGVVDDRKTWAKELKLAVKEHGHDEILNGFYEWSLAQSGSYFGRKPVGQYLRNVGQHIIASKPTVTNPHLEKLEKGIAICTDNKVFFTGEFRVRLALLVKDYGIQLVSQAFAEFWGGITEDKQLQWAARDFLQQAALRINTLKEKERIALEQAKAVAQAVELAKQNVVEEKEPEDDEL